MFNSDTDDNKKNQVLQDATSYTSVAQDKKSKNYLTDMQPEGATEAQTLQQSYNRQLAKNKKSKYEGKYCTAQKVAKTIGVTRQAVEKWRKQGIFGEDLITHEGVSL